MNPKIQKLKEKKLLGMNSTMHHGSYEIIVALWRQFMPQYKGIKKIKNNEFIAVQEYIDFNDLDAVFNIWACAEVIDFTEIPDKMTAFVIPEGDYAIFQHKGMDASATYQRIMTEWLPNSGYRVDERPHFQVMGDKYKQGSPDSEEHFYVPIKPLNE